MLNENYETTDGLDHSQVKQSNVVMKEWFSPESGAEGAEKAAASTTDYIRTRVREGSISRQILEPRKITNDEIQPSLSDDDPRYIGEIEADTPGGIVMPIGQRPTAWYFHGQRYEARFSRLATPRQMKDTAQLLTYKQDLRQVLSDANLKDLLYIEDTRFLRGVNTLLSWNGTTSTMASGVTLPSTGVIQWDQINDDVNPSSVTDSLTIMNRSNFGLDNATAVVNLNFAKQFMKWGRDEFGGNLAEEVKKNGFTEREFMGVRWIVTIKNWLVPDGVVFYFGPQKFIGESLVLEDATMHVRKDASMIEFWSYMMVAQVIVNSAAVARCDFLQAGWGSGALGS